MTSLINFPESIFKKILCGKLNIFFFKSTYSCPNVWPVTVSLVQLTKKRTIIKTLSNCDLKEMWQKIFPKIVKVVKLFIYSVTF